MSGWRNADPGTARAAGRPTLRTVALVGPDGAGKSSVVRAVAAALPTPTRIVYMGVNLEASREMLPTTRLALAIKRRRGGRPDMTAGLNGARGAPGARPSALREVRSVVRFVGWAAEEWYRAGLARLATRRGRLVLFDRHFYCDYHAADVRPLPGRTLGSRLHGWMLERLYPRPDLVIVLDAPAEVLYARKAEADVAYLEQRRRDYLDLAGSVPELEVVNGDQPIDGVTRDVVALIVARLAPVTAPGRDLVPTETRQPTSRGAS